MEFTEPRVLNRKQKKSIIALWNREYPKKLELPTIMDFEDYLKGLTDSSQQKKELGSKFLDLAKQRNTELNGWIIDNGTELKQNGENYKSPLGFYLKNGFEVLDGVELEKNGITGIKLKWKKKETTEK